VFNEVKSHERNLKYVYREEDYFQLFVCRPKWPKRFYTRKRKVWKRKSVRLKEVVHDREKKIYVEEMD
jgi:hypothetical protein